MDTTWSIIDDKNRWGEPAFAVVHHINKILHGFATRADAERYALAKAQEAAADGDETATVEDLTGGQQRHIWPPAEPVAPIGRTRKRPRR